jgi:hypothetical protein
MNKPRYQLDRDRFGQRALPNAWTPARKQLPALRARQWHVHSRHVLANHGQQPGFANGFETCLSGLN